MNRSSFFYFILVVVVMLPVSVHSMCALQSKFLGKIVHTTTRPTYTHVMKQPSLATCHNRNFSTEVLMPLVPFFPLISVALASLLHKMTSDKKPTEPKK